MTALLAIGLMLACSACTSTSTGGKNLDTRIHAYLLAHPEVLIEMQEINARNAEAIRIAQMRDLVRANADALFRDDRDASAGPKDARIVIAVFEDYQCGHCKMEAAPVIAGLLQEHPDVRIVFKEFPIFGDKSQTAARLAIAAARQGKFLPVYKALMAAPELDDAVIDKILAANDVNVAQARTVANSAAILAQLDDVFRLAGKMNVRGTPAFIVGDEVIVGADTDRIEQLIAGEKHRAEGTR